MNAERLRVEIAGPEQLPEVIAMAEAATDGAHWPREAWTSFVETSAAGGRQSVLLIARQGTGELRGWVAGTVLGEVGELEFLFVHAGQRRQGIGKLLLDAWISWAREQRAVESFLEVRASNQAALRLYAASGFQRQGQRRGYYSNPVEDAVVMRLLL